MIRRIITAAGLLLLAVPVALFGATRATLTGADGQPGTRVTVSLSVESEVAASGLQLSMTLPEGTQYAAGSATAAGRASAMSASGGVRDGQLNLTLFALDGATFSAGTGEVLTFDLDLGDTPMLADLSPRVILAQTDGSSPAVECQSTSLAIRGAALTPVTREYSLGRVALGEAVSTRVNVKNSGTDPLVINGVTGLDNWTLSNPVTIDAGSSGYVNLTFVPGTRGVHDEIVRLSSNASGADNPLIIHAEGFGRNEVSLAAQGVNGGEESTVSVRLKNYDPICGFTLRVRLPRNFTYVPGSFAINGERIDGHAVTASVADDKDGATMLTLTSYSFSNKSFKGNEGEVATFRVLAASRNGTYINIDKAVLPTVLDGAVTDVVSATSNAYLQVTSPTLNISRDNNLGRTPVTAEYVGSVSFANYGSAPLTITDWECEDEALVLTTELPITLDRWNWGSLRFERTDAERGVLTRTIKLHSNDPEAPVMAVNVTMDRYSPNELSLHAPDVDEVDDTVLLYVGLDNNDPAEGLQFDVHYDTALEGEVSVAATPRSAGFLASATKIADGVVRVVAYGIGSKIAEGSGDVLALTFKPVGELKHGSYAVSVSDVVISDSALSNIHSNMVAVSGTVSVNALLLGDANHDGQLSGIDLNLMLNHLVNPAVSSVNQKLIDMNVDGSISAIDLNLHVQKILYNE